MKGSISPKPARCVPRRRAGAIALLATFALTVGVRAQHPDGSPLPPLQPDLVRFATAKSADRDTIVEARRHTLVDGFRRLLRVAVSDRTGNPDTLVAGDAEALVRDFATRSERILGNDTLSVDTRTVLNLSDRALERRARLFTKFYSEFGKFRAISPLPADRVNANLRQVRGIVEQMRRFSREHEDRDLLRFAHAVRVVLDNQGGSGRSVTRRAASRGHIEALAACLAKHGFDRDVRYFIAERDLAHSYLRGGETEKAGAALRSARACVDLEGIDPVLRADLLSLELEYYKNRSYLQAARDAATSLERMIPAIEQGVSALPADDLRADRRAQLGSWYVQVAFVRIANGQLSSGHDILNRALERPGVADDDAAQMLVLLAQVKETLGDYAAGVRTAQRALTRSQDPGLEWQARLHEAACQALRGRIGDARKALVATADLDRERVPANDLARLQSRDALAHALVRKLDGDLEGALDACARALRSVLKDATSVDRVRALWFKSAILLELGEANEALEAAFDAREYATAARVNPRWQMFVSDLGIADILLSCGRPNEALERLDDALREGGAFLKSQPALRGEGRRLRAESAWRALDESQRDPKRTQALVDALGDAIIDLKKEGRGRFGTLRVAAETLRAYELVLEISLATTNTSAAHEVVEDARTYHQSLDRPDGAVRALAWAEVDASMEAIIARAAEASGDPETALHHYTKAARLESRLRAGLRWRAPDGLSARFEAIHDRMAYLHLKAAQRHGSPARARQALLFLEENRARSLRTLVAAAEARMVARTGANEEIGLLRPRKLDGDGLDALLVDGRTVLVYSLTGRGCYVFGLRGDHAEVHEMALDRKGLERQVYSLLSNLQGEPNAYKAGAVVDFGHRLWRELIGPVSHLVRDATELVIVPDGVLNGLPFGALVERPVATPADGRDLSNVPFLSARPGLEALTVAPSLATLTLLVERPPAKPERTVLLVGDPDLGHKSFTPLPHARTEIEAIAELADNAAVLVGPRATRGHMEAQRPGRFGTLHIATHTRRGRVAALLLAPDEAGGDPTELKPADVMGMRLIDTNLVVLSACATGHGKTAGPEGLIGLPRAFLIAGARRVLASNIEIVDDKTSRLMQLLYARMGSKHEQPARALLTAQRALLGSPKTSWPGFWAPFFVVGTP
ncbi:MAG: CHAT domain-containing tetratricopeptide repeat protein [Planctomycetota bacterium]|nr:CHAT domain-containing tetratricopeptide repeat protein [Planctomycetota bacterium]